MSDRRRQAGFTTVELMISAGIAAIMLAVSLQALGETLPRWRARQAAEDIAAAIRSGRAKAIRTGQTQLVTFDVTRHRYARPSLSWGNPNGVTLSLPRDIKFAAPSAGQASNSVNLQPPASQERAAEFNSRGWLRSQAIPGYVHLGDTRRGVYTRVVVDLAGAVRVERWRNGTWK